MNNNVNIRYELNYFSNNENIIDTKTAMNIIGSISKIQLLPNYVSLLTKDGVRKSLELSTEEASWIIAFLPDKISIRNVNNQNLGELEDFLKDAHDILQKILGVYKVTAKRLSLITEYFMKIEDTEKISDLYKKIFCNNSFYNKHTPFEWSLRIAGNQYYLINNTKEEINCITNLSTIKRLENGIAEIDGIQQLVDINTTHKFTDYRFNIDNIHEFIDKAHKTHIEMLLNIKNMLTDGD